MVRKLVIYILTCSDNVGIQSSPTMKFNQRRILKMVSKLSNSSSIDKTRRTRQKANLTRLFGNE